MTSSSGEFIALKKCVARSWRGGCTPEQRKCNLRGKNGTSSAIAMRASNQSLHQNSGNATCEEKTEHRVLSQCVRATSPFTRTAEMQPARKKRNIECYRNACEQPVP